MSRDYYQFLCNPWAEDIAYQSVQLAIAMGRDFRSQWNENYMEIDEASMAMLPYALQIMIATTSRGDN